MAATINDIVIKLKNLEKIDVQQALTKSALLVESDAKNRCPVDTGNLRNSITFSVSGNTAEVGTSTEYAPWVEMGTGLYAVNGDGRKDVPWKYKSTDGSWHTTSGRKATPFLGPALLSNEKSIIKIFEDAIKEALKK